MKLEFIVRTSNPDFLIDRHGDRVLERTYILEEGLRARLTSESDISSGIRANEIAVGFLIGIASGIPSSIVANRIYDHLMENGNNEIIVQEERITILTKEELIEYVNKTYAKDTD